MKKTTTPAEMSDEVLIKTEKSFRGIGIVTIIFLVVMVVLAIILTLKKGFSIFTVMPVVFLPIFMSPFMMWSKYRSELKKRNLL